MILGQGKEEKFSASKDQIADNLVEKLGILLTDKSTQKAGVA